MPRKTASAKIVRLAISSGLTRAPRRRRLPPGGARLRPRLKPLAVRGSPGPHYSHCALRRRTPSGARGTREASGLAEHASRWHDLLHNPPLVRDAGLANDLVLEVQYELTVREQ